MRHYSRTPAVLALAAAAVSLSCDRATAPPAPIRIVLPWSGVNATVELLQVEGGCWVIDVTGKHYQPTNLSPEYRVNGMRVRVTFHEEPNMGSFCMVGPIVTLDHIQKR